jgi:RNA polymerase sigma factor (sigma-70 family)
MQNLFGKARNRLSPPAPVSAGTRAAEEQERLLLRQIAAKNHHAFETLYRQYAPRLHRYFAKLLSQPELVEELLDDVMVVVWQNAVRYDDTAKPSTWIFGIAHFKALKARTRLHKTPTDPPVNPAAPTYAEAPEELLMYDGLQHELRRALERLSPEQRAVVELTFHEERSYQEIADIMGCPINTVKTRMWHARQYLKAALAELHPLRTSVRQSDSARE